MIPFIQRFMVFVILCAAIQTVCSDLLLAQENEEEEEEQNWNLSMGAKYLSRYTSFGVDLSQDHPALMFEAGLFHSSGLSLGADAITGIGSNGGYQQSSFHLGYTRHVNDRWSLSGTYTYHSYKSDTLSVIATLNSSLALGATYHLGKYNFTGTYNIFFGGGSANYISLGVSTTYELGKLTIEPTLETSIASQTVADSLLPKNRGQGAGQGQGQGKGKDPKGNVLLSTITGLSGLYIIVPFTYAIGTGLSISVAPSYVYSPTDLSARSSQILWAAGVSYSVDF